MKQIILHPRTATSALMARLERLGIIGRAVPTRGLLSACGEKGRVERLSATSDKHGGPALFGIAKRDTRDGFQVHPDPETIMLICGGAEKFDPLYMIFSLRPARELEGRAVTGKISPADFLCLRMVFNDPRLSVFTVLPGRAHCELTRRTGRRHPIFFVSEPSRPVCHKLNLGKYEVTCG